MQGAAFYGNAGENQLSLGLFNGPYSLSALSYIAEHQRQLALSRRSIYDAENFESSSSSRSNIYDASAAKTEDQFLADFLNSELEEQKQAAALNPEQVRRERDTEEFKRTRGQVATGMDGKLSAADRLSLNTSDLLLKQKKTLTRPLGPKSEEKVV
jgi:hypothetical protein